MDGPSTHPISSAPARREATKPLREVGIIKTHGGEAFRKRVPGLLLFAGLFLIVLALALGFGPLALDPFPPSAPPM
jgi:hypothetical protein